MRHPPGREKAPLAESMTALVGDFCMVAKLVVIAVVPKQNCSSLLIYLPSLKSCDVCFDMCTEFFVFAGLDVRLIT
jgi:hypothetical protein